MAVTTSLINTTTSPRPKLTNLVMGIDVVEANGRVNSDKGRVLIGRDIGPKYGPKTYKELLIADTDDIDDLQRKIDDLYNVKADLSYVNTNLGVVNDKLELHGDMLAALGDATEQNANDISNNASDIYDINELIKTKEADFNDLIDSKESSINDRIDTEVSTLNTTISDNVDTLNSTIETNKTDINDRIDTEVSTLNTTISDNKSELQSEIADSIDNLNTDLTDQISSYQTDINATIDTNKNDINSRVDDEVSTLNATIDTKAATNGSEDIDFNAKDFRASTITETSARKYKENIEPLTGCLENVLKMEPVTYNRIGRDNVEIGLIADDVAEFRPEYVMYKNDEIEGIHYQRIVADLIGAVKELQKEIEELKINNTIY